MVNGLPEVSFPTVHLNGTSRAELEDQIREAHGAVSNAIEKLQDAAPNARDYYVNGPDAYPKARREHEARMHKLADVAHELLAIFAKLDEQAGR